jgi:hypothetical protein
MRNGISKSFVVAALTALLALGFIACGDDEGPSQDSGPTASSKEAESQDDGGAEGSAADFEPAPLKVSGEGAELREAAEAVHGFYVARASGQWDAACSQIAQPMLVKLEGLAAQTEVKGCPEFLESFTTPMSSAAWREVTVMDAESLRSEGGRATLVYRGTGGETYSIPLREEGGEWKVEALQATPSG